MEAVTGVVGSEGAGAPPSIEELYAARRRSAVQLATMLTGSRARGEELVQDVFLRMHVRWDEVANPRAYLRQAVVNACRSDRRREERAERREARVGVVDEVAAPEADDDGLRAAIRALPERQRAVLVLRYFEDLPDDEIARLLGCRPATVRSVARRALLRLREVVEP
jgi:RNA polymerase sigma factor (sigma-70 family)